MKCHYHQIQYLLRQSFRHHSQNCYSLRRLIRQTRQHHQFHLRRHLHELQQNQ